MQEVFEEFVVRRNLFLDNMPSQISVKDKAEIDKTVLRLVQHACEEGDQFKALDLCTTLYLSKSLNIAIKIY